MNTLISMSMAVIVIMNKLLTKDKIAAENFTCGFNCAQSVLLAFHEEVGLDRNTALKLASSFGGGMGRMREVCGAVSAMFMIAGILKGYVDPNNDVIKQKHYQLIQDLAAEFKSHFGTIICRELLGEEGKDTSSKPSERTKEYYATRPCSEFIKTAAQIIEEKLIK